ncbi:glioma pathogenesis-related protein 1-like [Paramormyrops kingsleyae]|uniref:glioma pathogenesis-related protein 1-like n=1 Tax=Paramormyrops kingsleyae TaxID=1676925 RepID=UPI003B976C10
MAVQSLYLAICTVIITSITNAQPLTDITNETFIDMCVSAHNKHRSRVTPPASDMMYMTWDETLAKVAQDWASRCIFDHNPLLQMPYKLHPSFKAVGENIWRGWPVSIFSVEPAVQLWVDEVQHYTYMTKKCTGVCGHYTQVVWAKSYKVGCAVHVCSGNPQFAIFVCDYGDAGNFVGRYPYQQGTPCSSCPGKKCWSNLCYDPKEVKLKEYDWASDSDQTSNKICSPYCVSVLVCRPLLLLFTVLGVLGVQKFYPNLFVSE